MQASTPRPLRPLDMTRAPSSGWYRSRTMARAHMTAAPMAAPWTTRQAISIAIEGAKVLPIEARV